MRLHRRSFLQLLGGGAAALAFRQALAAPRAGSDEFFVFIHAAGGWDVTLWADPRNERRGLVEPASTENTDTGAIKLWKPARLDGASETFEILGDPAMPLGPAIGDLYDLRDRVTIINGLAMNTVSHPDGTVFSATGRHLAGGHAPASSIDVAVASELGTEQLLPAVSIGFPSSFIGDQLDRRAIPLRVNTAAAVTKSLARSDAYLDDTDRDAISTLLAAEAGTLAAHSTYPEVHARIASQHAAIPQLLSNQIKAALSQKALQDAYPQLDYRSKFQAAGALSAAFAIEAMKKNLVRSVGFTLGGLDTHNANYKGHAQTLQELFAVIATTVKLLDRTPHPTRANAKLSEHTHILVVSEFCRTPQITLTGGRDHYPNNSALVISPKFRGGRTFGASDAEQLLPANAGTFGDGPRPVAPPDVLATFLAAVGIEPRRYLRDGEVVRELLR